MFLRFLSHFISYSLVSCLGYTADHIGEGGSSCTQKLSPFGTMLSGRQKGGYLLELVSFGSDHQHIHGFFLICTHKASCMLGYALQKHKLVTI